MFTDEQFAGLFSARGNRAWSPGRLALVMLQLVENLTDRRAAEAVRARIDWEYALWLYGPYSPVRPERPMNCPYPSVSCLRVTIAALPDPPSRRSGSANTSHGLW